MIIISTHTFVIELDEQRDEMAVIPKWDAIANKQLLMNGGESRDPAKILTTIMQLPDGYRE